MRVSLGRPDRIPDDRCVVTTDGRAVVVRVGDEFRAYVNRCPHEGHELTSGWIRDGVLVCPHHFWRFETSTGNVVGRSIGLEQLPCHVSADDVTVELTEPEPERSIRQQLLDHAKTWRREAE